MLCSVLAYWIIIITIFFLTFRFYIYSKNRSIKSMYFVMKTNKMGEKFEKKREKKNSNKK